MISDSTAQLSSEKPKSEVVTGPGHVVFSDSDEQHHSRTPSPSPEPRLGRFGHKSIPSIKIPLLRTCDSASDDEHVATPRVRKCASAQAVTPSPELRVSSSVPSGRFGHSSVPSDKLSLLNACDSASENENVATPRLRECVSGQVIDTEASLLDERYESSQEEVGKEATEMVVADGPEKKGKKKCTRAFKATRLRYRKFMTEQRSAIKKDPFNIDLKAVNLPSCLSKDDGEAKIMLKLHMYLQVEQAKQAALQPVPLILMQDGDRLSL